MLIYKLGTSGLKTQKDLRKKKGDFIATFYTKNTQHFLFVCFSVNTVVDILCTIPNIRSC